MRGNVFSIEEFSTFDGPGIRSTVFLKGCPLRCQWCHNPEGREFENSVLRSPNGCLHCGNCIRAADHIGDRVILNEASIRACPKRLLRWCAAEYTPQELIARLEKLIPILNSSGGGITFSGGEPLAQPEFLVDCLQRLDGKTDRAVQTCGYAPADVFCTVLDNTDRVLYDIKLVDEKLHQYYTGVSNRRILDNFHTLANSGKSFVVRTPLIPGVTDTKQNVSAICELLSKENVHYIELLPYNPMAGSKYALVGLEYLHDFDDTKAVSIDLEQFTAYGIDAKVV